jgi:hypothetical protein
LNVSMRRNGQVFASSEELADQLMELLSGYPRATPLLSKMRANLTHVEVCRGRFPCMARQLN